MPITETSREPQSRSLWSGNGLDGEFVELGVSGDQTLGGRHHHVKIRDADGLRVTTDGVYTGYFDPDVFVSRQRITGDPGIDSHVPLELRVEFRR